MRAVHVYFGIWNFLYRVSSMFLSPKPVYYSLHNVITLVTWRVNLHEMVKVTSRTVTLDFHVLYGNFKMIFYVC